MDTADSFTNNDDDEHNKNTRTEREKKKNTVFTLINTNARSLCPKINSLIDCMEELDASAAVVTETWLADGQHLNDDSQDLFLGAGLSMICRNRPRNPATGVAHGGVAIIYKEEDVKYKEISFPNPESFEILVAAGSIQGHIRQILTIACYMPPNYTVDRANKCLDYVYDVIIEFKRRYKNPYITVCGDFNQWEIEKALEEFRDLVEAPVGPKRGLRTIDRMFTNLESITECATLAPLQTDGDDGRIRESDHRIVYLTSNLPRKEKYKWLSYSYRYNNVESAKEFGDRIGVRCCVRWGVRRRRQYIRE